MCENDFVYDSYTTSIQCKENETLKDICLKYSSKSEKDINSLYFLYAGNKIDINLNFDQISNKMDKERKKMTLLVNDVNQIDNNINKYLKKSKEIICPQCKENIRIKIKDYKIFLFQCKNGHKIYNMPLSDFENTQYIDENNIICDYCNQIKAKTYNNLFYVCYSCNKKLCPLCKNNHDQSHIIVNYDDKNYNCELHNELFTSYCRKCNKNICMFCENEHENHVIIYYKDILPNKDKIKNELKELRNKIDIMNDNIKEICNMLNKVSEYMEILYKINNDIIENYNTKNRNYQILQNINRMNNRNMIYDINNIINENKFDGKIKYISEIYYKMINTKDNDYEIDENNSTVTKKEKKEEEIDEINIIYKKDKKEDRIHIFGSKFVENNKDKCNIIYNDKEYALTEEFEIKNYKKNEFEIKLKGIKKITNMSYMFCDCESLISLPNFEKWNTINVTNMSYLFFSCSSLLSLPDISKWDLSNVKTIDGIFYKCSALKSLPDISKWNTINVNNMSCIFDSLTLTSLPDISKWNTSNVTCMTGMFEECSFLESLPDISIWDISKVTKMNCMFYNCSSLKSLPDISKWNTSNVIDMSWMFLKCSSLSSLPDISKWNIKLLKDKKMMFDGCKKSLNIPSQFK